MPVNANTYTGPVTCARDQETGGSIADRTPSYEAWPLKERHKLCSRLAICSPITRIRSAQYIDPGCVHSFPRRAFLPLLDAE
ncbi:hypothetical protein LshimejAT787_1300110 [Lyophyllum shimeji]|uniref:Uncharacterized protein n=1 Tax=Lyophyllum shimeji TaxID=47721 RepID=A0A9P3PUF0_LYOSH|nr:hypothetical protein LshimejAT787_1300110 [Lyophyllum shimeji]